MRVRLSEAPLAAQEAQRSASRAGKAQAAANPLLEGLGIGQYVLRAAARVKAADLEQALLMLPFHDALRLLGYLRDGMSTGAEVGRPRDLQICQSLPTGYADRTQAQVTWAAGMAIGSNCGAAWRGRLAVHLQ